MAANDTKLVSAGKPKAAGAISAGLTSLTPPTSTDSILPEGIVKLGYVSEDGLTNTIDKSTESVTAWGGDTVMIVNTSRTETFSWTFIQSLDVDVLKEVYGQDNVTGTLDTGLTVLHNGKDMPHRLYVFEMALTGGAAKRIVVPDAQITEVGDVQYVDGTPIGYEVTLTCFPDNDGNTVYEYIKAPAA